MSDTHIVPNTFAIFEGTNLLGVVYSIAGGRWRAVKIYLFSTPVVKEFDSLHSSTEWLGGDWKRCTGIGNPELDLQKLKRDAEISAIEFPRGEGS